MVQADTSICLITRATRKHLKLCVQVSQTGAELFSSNWWGDPLQPSERSRNLSIKSAPPPTSLLGIASTPLPTQVLASKSLQ